MITPDDAIMALSWSGETAELKDLIDYSRRFRIGLVAITADAASTLAKAADVALVLPQAREACPHNLAPTTSSLMQLALGDALAIALLESRGFTPVISACCIRRTAGRAVEVHRDVMHSGTSVPLVPLGTRMSIGVLEMSAKGLGCVGITDGDGNLTGIVTDGDLRRHMRDDLLNARVEDIMTRSPKTIRPDQLVSEALGSAQLDEDHRTVRCRCRTAGRDRAYPRSAAHRRGLERLRSGRGATVALLYVVTRDWYSCPIACRWRARRATRASRFMWRRGWLTAPPRSRRRLRAASGAFRARPHRAIRHRRHDPRAADIHRSIAPDIVHHVALQATILGSIAAAGLAVSTVNALTGLGYTFTSGNAKAMLLRPI